MSDELSSNEENSSDNENVEVEFVPEGEETPAQPDFNIVDFHKHVVEANIRMIQQLELLGKPMPKWMHVQSALETLIDMLFDDSETLQKYHVAVDVNLHGKLEHMLESTSGLATPSPRV